MRSEETSILIPILLLIHQQVNNVYINNNDPMHEASRAGIVHLFEWKFDDIANECESFLAPNGYAAVQVSPVSENAILEGRPWYERYQPISYRIASRSGDESSFRSMVQRCNRVGIRIYVDVIPNHMAAHEPVHHTQTIGDKEYVLGTGGSTADPLTLTYPEIPYGPEHFHPPCKIVDYRDKYQVRNCELVNLPDLDQSHPIVRDKIVDFLNKLIDIGVAGFRVDASKHMWPEDLEVIYGRIKNLSTRYFPANQRPYIYQEVIDLGGEAVKKTEYIHMGAVTDFKFSAEIGKVFRGKNELKWLKTWGPDWGLLPSEYALVFVDNHDNQRGHGAGGQDILTYKKRREYVMAVSFMLAHPFGNPRVMSSYDFTLPDEGPPADKYGNTKSPHFNPSSGQCDNEWVCEHRWPEIRNMIKFRGVVGSAPSIAWYDNDANQIAFCRGIRGFVAFNNDDTDMNQRLFTCLPSGIYCDVITGQRDGLKCTGGLVMVDKNGEAHIQVSARVGVLAIHIGERL